MDFDDFFSEKVPLNCTPKNNVIDKCHFSGSKLYTSSDDIFAYNPYIMEKLKGTDLQEAKEINEEFKIIVLKRGTILVHATKAEPGVKFLKVNKKFEGKVLEDCWWSKFYPGQKIFGGGWFTHQDRLGGPPFPIFLYYRLKEDIALLYIPNTYTNIVTDKNQHIAEMKNEGYSSSHLIQGVTDWKEKGYKQFTDYDPDPGKFYADGLAVRLTMLGFNGYVSCDECEVYINHNAMKHVLTHPYRVDFTGDHKDPENQETKDKLKFIMEYCGEKNVPLTVTKIKSRNEERVRYIFSSEYTNILKKYDNPDNYD